ncbi:MAG TPA: hypothetical protein VEQ18_03760, partial [Candidatus Nitrosocosmicus sp.]|nr:hypothetical protein [Candidatus Nitrosocosmicus sp.]
MAEGVGGEMGNSPWGTRPAHGHPHCTGAPALTLPRALARGLPRLSSPPSPSSFFEQGSGIFGGPNPNILPRNPGFRFPGYHGRMFGFALAKPRALLI